MSHNVVDTHCVKKTHQHTPAFFAESEELIIERFASEFDLDWNEYDNLSNIIEQQFLSRLQGINVNDDDKNEDNRTPFMRFLRVGGVLSDEDNKHHKEKLACILAACHYYYGY